MTSLPLLMLFQAPRSEAFARASQAMLLGMLIVVAMVVIGVLILRAVRQSLAQDNPQAAKYEVLSRQAELLKLARSKLPEGQATPKPPGQPSAAPGQPAAPQPPEDLRREEQEAARTALAAAAGGALGAACPHCSLAMERDEQLVLCPLCMRAQHRVCFDLAGCAGGCQPEWVYEHPAGRFRELRRP